MNHVYFFPTNFMAGINVTFQFDHLLKQLESMELMSKQAFLFLLAVSTKQDLALDFGTEAFVYKSEVKLFFTRVVIEKMEEKT